MSPVDNPCGSGCAELHGRPGNKSGLRLGQLSGPDFDEFHVSATGSGHRKRQRLGKRLTVHDAALIRAGVRSPAMEHAVRDHLRFYTGRSYPRG